MNRNELDSNNFSEIRSVKMIETVKKSSLKLYNSDGGFTLIETMIALFILAFGILGILTLSVTSIKMDFKARRMTEATTLNADRNEKLILTKYDDLVPGAGGPIVEGKYTTTWNVSAGDLPIPNVKTVTITTQWQENGQARSVQYVYYKAKTF
jgi:type II secretory pathway pseudopilin PulG